MAAQTKKIEEPLLNEKGQEFGVDITELGFLFHPDNIHHPSPDNFKRSISISELWKHGGAKGLAHKLKSDSKNGIIGGAQDIKNRINAFGANSKRPPKIRTLWELILENFEDRILQILLIAALVALIIGIWKEGIEHGWIEGLSIFIAVAIIVSVTAGNNYIKEKQFQKLVSKAAEGTVAVYRGEDGSTHTISTTELVVGDLIKIESGMKIPADCILMAGTDVAADESAMTGEPEQMEKSAVSENNVDHSPNPFLLANTLVASGQGVALVCAVGSHTRSGMAEEKLNIEDEETPLQGKLETIANEIGKVGLYVAINLLSVDTLKKVIEFVIIAITVIVVAVPEGLPLAVTISLAFSVMKMKEENNLVRKLEASETMGGANEICTDKTGTLTKNQMTVKEIYFLDTIYTGVPAHFNTLPRNDLLAEGVLFNCSARIERNELGVLETKGNCTEQGLISYLMDAGVQADHLLRQKDDKILQVIPFNSKRKRACTAIRHPTKENLVRVFVKGAPEIVLELCESYFDKDGQTQTIGKSQRDRIVNDVVTNSFAKKAFRTLLIAYADLTNEQYDNLCEQNNNFASEVDREVLESSLTVIGIYALQDPLRDEIVQSVKDCHKAGINIRMVTGDNLDTAKAIALEAGIINAEEAETEFVCMEGKQFREICGGLVSIKDENNTDGKLREEIGNKGMFRIVKDKLKVLARSTPEDKYMLVTGLKEFQSVVAVTGDGTNDAPALKRADVGFAMGITGTEVAKEASDIILLDDNFASILTAVKWGRNIYENVRKFLQFQLTVNVVAMFIVFLGGVAKDDPPLTSVQMLWVNLIMDTCAALALATEPPGEDLLDRKPYSRNDLIVTPVMWRNITGQAIFQIIVLVTLLFGGKNIFSLTYTDSDPFYVAQVPNFDKVLHYTLIFHTFVFMQVFNEINSRKLGEREYNVFHGFFNNLLFLLIIVFTIAVQCVLVQYGGQSVRTVPLTWQQHVICIGIGASSLIVGLIVKAILPVSLFTRIQMKEEPLTEEEQKVAFTSTFRKSFRQSKRQSTLKTDIQ
ncbi:calcium-translocating p-type pmca-type family protein [Stylonychia lemnae]|uniref:P-type Ca(2+) transporter n=1 Tax=Stylonychia lemnae TaxID=5949 RepID=A0A078B4L4_STYLE|nr:calcium-translocating p-type pmca-type family protein [Stylonychia lemnae]|eukprot:CDW88443.1 calcium-translocating p-type pmca-type family protein [Stylonychia lemnae]